MNDFNFYYRLAAIITLIFAIAILIFLIRRDK